jgi:hypothetical protein
MKIVKRILGILLSKMVFVYITVILLNIVSILFENAHTALSHINVFMGLSLIPFFVLIALIGVPHYEKCKKCGSRMQIKYTIESGTDISNRKYEHFFDVTECLSCENEEIEHLKVEVRHFKSW